MWQLLWHGISNHQHLDCLCNSSSWPTSKKISKVCITGPLWGKHWCLPFMRGIHCSLVVSAHKGPITWIPFSHMHDIIVYTCSLELLHCLWYTSTTKEHMECIVLGTSHPHNYINPSYGLSLVDTLWNASSYQQPIEQEGNPMTWIEKLWLQISLIVTKKS